MACMTPRLEELQRTIQSLQRVVSSSSLTTLPDAGAKLHTRLANLRKELATLQGYGKQMLAVNCNSSS